MDQTVTSILLSVVFALLGFILLWVGYKMFDVFTPADIEKQVFDQGNMAAAVLTGAFIIGLAIVVAAAIS